MNLEFQRPFLKKRIIVFIVVLCLFLLCYFLEKQNVANLHTLVRDDPLFYSPEVDTQALAESIAKLNESEQTVRNTIDRRVLDGTLQNSDQELPVLKKIIEQGFMPISYLNSLPNAIAQTDYFLSSASIGTAFKMSFAVLRAADTYELEAAKTLALAKEAAATIQPYTLRMLGSETSSAQQLSDLERIVMNGTELKKEARERLWCLFTFSCDKLTEHQKQSDIKNEVPPKEEHQLLPDNIASLELPDLPRFGPYYVKNNCLQYAYAPLYLFTDDEKLFLVKDATDNYYYHLDDVLPVEGDAMPNYLQKLYDAGLTYDVQREGADYRCTDLTYWGEISTIYYFNTKSNHPDITSSEDLYELEKELRTTDQTDETVRNLRILENKLVGLPTMLHMVIYYLDYNNILAKDYQPNISPLYFLIIRSDYSLLFQTFSRSVWRLEVSPQYVIEHNLTPAPEFTTYTALKDDFSLDEIRSFHTRGKEIIH